MLVPVPWTSIITTTLDSDGAYVIDYTGSGITSTFDVYVQAYVDDSAGCGGAALSNALQIEVTP